MKADKAGRGAAAPAAQKRKRGRPRKTLLDGDAPAARAPEDGEAGEQGGQTLPAVGRAPRRLRSSAPLRSRDGADSSANTPARLVPLPSLSAGPASGEASETLVPLSLLAREALAIRQLAAQQGVDLGEGEGEDGDGDSGGGMELGAVPGPDGVLPETPVAIGSQLGMPNALGNGMAGGEISSREQQETKARTPAAPAPAPVAAPAAAPAAAAAAAAAAPSAAQPAAAAAAGGRANGGGGSSAQGQPTAAFAIPKRAMAQVGQKPGSTEQQPAAAAAAPAAGLAGAPGRKGNLGMMLAPSPPSGPKLVAPAPAPALPPAFVRPTDPRLALLQRMRSVQQAQQAQQAQAPNGRRQQQQQQQPALPQAAPPRQRSASPAGQLPRLASCPPSQHQQGQQQQGQPPPPPRQQQQPATSMQAATRQAPAACGLQAVGGMAVGRDELPDLLEFEEALRGGLGPSLRALPGRQSGMVLLVEWHQLPGAW